MTAKKRSTSTGLGRGLAGILGNALSEDRAPEVAGLLGAEQVRRDPEVRRLVTELALDSLADSFGADVVLIVARDDEEGLATVSPRLPSNWNSLEPVAFESIGRLWNVLADSSDDGPELEQIELDGVWLLTCSCTTSARPMAAAILRTNPFDDREQQTIVRLMRSVAMSLYGDVEPPAEAAIRVLTRESGDGVLADVRLGDASNRRNAAAVADDAVTAVARAASELCDAALEVQFAGQTRVQSRLVTIVVLGDHAGGPLFGLAVTDGGSSAGPAEAVFNAARVANYDPFVLTGER